LVLIILGLDDGIVDPEERVDTLDSPLLELGARNVGLAAVPKGFDVEPRILRQDARLVLQAQVALRKLPDVLLDVIGLELLLEAHHPANERRPAHRLDDALVRSKI